MTATQSAVELDVRPLSGNIGAEIHGLDLRQPLNAETVAAVRATWLKHRVVFFPQQHLQPAEHLAFARQLGEVTPAHPVMPGLDGFPEIYEIDYGAPRKLAASYGDVARGAKKGRGLSWHTDVTFVERPPTGSILNAVVIPPSGGDTMWSNQVAAFADLSPVMQEFLGTLTGVHDGRAAFGAVLAKGGEVTWEGETYNQLQPVEHPVVRTHPETGEKSLFVNPGFTSYIKQLSGDESRMLLAFLYQHSTRPEFTVRYHWRQGDLGMWDNRATQHSVVGDYGDQPRVIQRVTLRGDKPV
jgi:alpha-ketoglutarate-dependent taurine dioxygenase